MWCEMYCKSDIKRLKRKKDFFSEGQYIQSKHQLINLAPVPLLQQFGSC